MKQDNATDMPSGTLSAPVTAIQSPRFGMAWLQLKNLRKRLSDG